MKAIALSTVVLIGVVCVGCRGSADRNRMRIDKAIRSLTEYPLMQGTASGDRIQASVLRLLSESNDKSLAQPRLACAIVLAGSDELRLTVYWVEEAPTLREVTVSSDHGSLSLAIDEHDRRVLTRRADEDGDLAFYAIWEFPNESDDARMLRRGKLGSMVSGIDLSGENVAPIALDWFVRE